MTKSMTLSRRDLLRYGAGVGGALVVMSTVPFNQSRAADENTGAAIKPYIVIKPDGVIDIACPNPDMGQGVFTSITMLVAEELDADWEKVNPVSMPLALTMTDGRLRYKYVPQGSGGSTSIVDGWTAMREAGVIARELLKQAAAEAWNTSSSDLSTEKGVVKHPDGRTLPYADLATAASEISLPNDVRITLRPKSEWNIIGRSKKQKAAHDIVTGKPIFGIDATYPGMKIAVFARSPYLDGEVISFNADRARAIDGVVDIVKLDRPAPDGPYSYLAGGVAVVADSFWTAKKARDLLEIEWDRGPFEGESTESFERDCDDKMAGTGQVARRDGDVAAAKAGAERVITRRYRMPYVSHAQLEPQSAIAHIMDGRANVIGPFQSLGGAARTVSTVTGIDVLKISVDGTRLGGGFGRRLTSDHAAEAAAISKATGLPIKVMWTREDDLSHDFYRPAGLHEMVAALDTEGRVTAWQHRLASASKYYRRANVPEEDMWTPELYADDFPAGLVDNLELEYFSMKSGMPRGSWRAPAHTANAFVMNSFLAEIAEETGQDMLALWLNMLGPDQELPYGQHGGPVFDTGRLRSVLTTVAEKAGWGRDMPDGRALGLAGHFTFGGYLAHVAEVERLDEGFKLHKVWSAVDIGIVVNPAGVIAQTEGGINDGLSTMLGQQVRVEGGRVINDNFDTYPMMRIRESAPEVDVTIIESDKPPSGMGEMSIPPIAAAVTNAYRNAGGARLRDHPVRPI